MTGQPKNSIAKPLASLSSTLLARKGTARPAMRPQGFGGFGSPQSAQDDLGWNDMGDHDAAAPLAEVPVPPVLVQREVLREEFATPEPEPEPEAKSESEPEPVASSPVAEDVAKPLRPVSVATATRIGRETRAKHVAHARSAFTLRLDTDRHLKLRLASALQNRSAQQLVTEALDALLETLPEVETLVGQLPTRGARKI